MKKHNFMIDALRFVAALAVVLFHLNKPTPLASNWYRTAVTHGWLGVPVFFVVSGYCIALSAQHSANKSDFLCRRFFRIFPAYWVSLILVVLAACYQKVHYGHNSIQGLPMNAGAFFAMLTLTTAPFSSVQTINWVYWSLTCELFFYMAVWFALFFNKNRMIWALVVLSAIVGFLPAQNTGLVFIFDQWPAFGLGLGVYYYFNQRGKYPVAGYGLLLVFNLYALIVHSAVHPSYIIVTVLTAGMIFISCIKQVPQNTFSNLGRYSYSVYLVHVPIGVFFLSLFESKYFIQFPLANLAYDVGVYVLISLVAWTLFSKVEAPFINFGRKFSERFFYHKYLKI